MVPRVVITGAPASGKTEFFVRLKKETKFKNFEFFDELARKLLKEYPEYQTQWSRFHIDIYNQQIAREDEVGVHPFISDRGTVDAFAFHPETAAKVGTTIEREYRRYSDVIQLGSSASLGDRYYSPDLIRTESVKSALEIEDALKSAWGNHPGHRFIAARVDFEEKFDNFMTIMNRIAEKFVDI